MLAVRSGMNHPHGCRLYQLKAEELARADEARSSSFTIKLCTEIADQYLIAAENCEDRIHKSTLISLAERWMLDAARLSVVIPNGVPKIDAAMYGSHHGAGTLKNSRELPTEEALILSERSELFGNRYPPIDTVKLLSSVEKLIPWTDGSCIPIGDKLKGFLLNWKLIGEFRTASTVRYNRDHASKSASRPLQRERDIQLPPTDRVELVQGLLRDCTIVASLAAIYQRNRPLLEHIWPGSDHLDNRDGKIEFVRLYFNGDFRIVSIDKRLPISCTQECIYVTDKLNPDNLVPALLEKACMQVRGGYDTRGGSCAQDLLTLTGWLPELLYFRQGEEAIRTRLKQVAELFNTGDVLLTVGTQPLTDQELASIRLIANHAYTVMKIDHRSEGIRLCLQSSWDSLAECSQPTEKGHAHSKADGLQPKSMQEKGGQEVWHSSWFTVHELVAYFHCLTLNWKPTIFQYRKDAHFLWDQDWFLRCSQSSHLFDHPQFVVRASQGKPVWLLLMRHYMGSSASIRPFEEARLCDEDSIRQSPFIGVSASSSDGRRRLIVDGSAHHSHITDERHALLKLEPVPSEILTVIPLCQLDASRRSPPGQTFTLSIFSTHNVQLDLIPPSHTYQAQIVSCWELGTAGGSISNASWSENPQVCLEVPKSGPVILILTSANPQLFVHIYLLHRSKLARFYRLQRQDIVRSSGAYRRASAVIQLDSLQAGRYIIICSTSDPGQCAEFRLIAAHDTALLKLILLPGEDAGKFRKDLTVTLSPGLHKMIMPVKVSRAGNLQLIDRTNQHAGYHELANHAIQYLQGRARRSPLRFSIMWSPAGGEAAAAENIGLSPFEESRSGDRTELVHVVSQEDISIVVERDSSFAGQMMETDESIVLKILSDMEVSLGQWVAEV